MQCNIYVLITDSRLAMLVLPHQTHLCNEYNLYYSIDIFDFVMNTISIIGYRYDPKMMMFRAYNNYMTC